MLRCVLAVLAVLWSSSSFANPVMLEGTRARQVPHTRHVQLTFVRDDGAFGAMSLTRDDQPITSTWVAGTYSANMGSGVVSQPSRQTCDCNVPVGTHAWALTSDTRTLHEGLDVLADAPDLVPADAGNPDAMPWDQPDPVQLQGLDCAAVCPAPTGPDASTAGPDAAPAADASAPAKTDSGCSQGLAPMALGTIALAAFALAGIAVRRRRG